MPLMPGQSRYSSRKGGIAEQAGTPTHLQAFLMHGVDLDWHGRDQANGDCPFCGREGKLSVAVKTGLFDCKAASCAVSGNPLTFLRLLWERMVVTPQDLVNLRQDRNLHASTTLSTWDVRRSHLTGEWCVPGYTVGGKLKQVYRWIEFVDGKGKRHRRLQPTPGLGYASGEAHGIFGMNLWDASKPDVMVTEGIWDGMALWEVLRASKRSGSSNGQDFLSLTAVAANSLAASTNVVALPGCNVFARNWPSLFAGKNVTLLFDNDRPRSNQKPPRLPFIGCAGHDGMVRATQALMATGNESSRPASVKYLRWGTDAVEGFDPELPDGFDVRDALGGGVVGLVGRVAQLEALLSRVEDAPAEWGTRSLGKTSGHREELDCVPCQRWVDVLKAWHAAFHMTPGHQRVLAFCFAIVTSTESVGNQLWGKVVGPPSSGKTAIAEALSVNKRFVHPRDTLSGGLFSGFALDRGASEDFSLMAKVKDKTLIIKDADTLLQLPDRAKVFSQLRAAWDRNVRTSYGNAASRNYEGWSVTVILNGTEAMREIDESDLGERFLDCLIVDDIDETLDRLISMKAAMQELDECSFKSDGRMETRDGPAMVRAKQLTGGYVGWLRENAQELLGGVIHTEETASACVDLGMFVAYLRARPGKKMQEKVQREMSPRLSRQMARLSKCLAVVLNKRTVDADVMRIAAKVALDTARGKTFEIVKALVTADERGMSQQEVTLTTKHGEDEDRTLLSFLRKLKAVVTVTQRISGGNVRKRWRLSPLLAGLYAKVVAHA